MNKKLIEEALSSLHQGDPSLAAQVLTETLRNDDHGEFLFALRRMTEAFGGIPKVAEQAKFNPERLEGMLSLNGNPSLSSLLAVLKAMGMQLKVAASNW